MKITIKNGIEDINIYFKKNDDGFYECYKSENDINNIFEDSLSAVVNGFLEYSFVRKGDDIIFDRNILKEINIKYIHQQKYQNLPIKDALYLYSLTKGRLFEIYMNDELIISNESIEELEARLKSFELIEFA